MRVLYRLLRKADHLEQLASAILPPAARQLPDPTRGERQVVHHRQVQVELLKTIPIRCRTAETSAPLAVISTPSKTTRPASIGSRRLTHRSSVLLRSRSAR